MKKIVLFALSLLVSAAAVSAQDMTAATDAFNNGATALNMGDNQGAIDYFKQAIQYADPNVPEGAEIISTCKDRIPRLVLAMAKDFIQSENYDEAVAKLQESITAGKEYENNDVIAEAGELIPQVYIQKGNTLLNSKDFAGAAESYRKSVEIDSTNGMASLRLGMALASSGDIAGAEAAYKTAMRNGQEKNAVKQLSNTYIKLAAASLKAKKYDNAVSYALKSNEYAENATAMQVAGQAALQLGKSADAIGYFEQYVAMAPTARNVNDICYSIAVLAQQSGDNAKACGYYKKIASDAKYGETAKQQIAALKCN